MIKQLSNLASAFKRVTGIEKKILLTKKEIRPIIDHLTDSPNMAISAMTDEDQVHLASTLINNLCDQLQEHYTQNNMPLEEIKDFREAMVGVIKALDNDNTVILAVPTRFISTLAHSSDISTNIRAMIKEQHSAMQGNEFAQNGLQITSSKFTYFTDGLSKMAQFHAKNIELSPEAQRIQLFKAGPGLARNRSRHM